MTTIVLPAFDRPEMLWHCLDRIDKADKPDPWHLMFRLDYGYNRELEEVIRMFGHFPASVSLAKKHPFSSFTKQSANVLGGLWEATRGAEPTDIIHLIEDDVMVARDHFTFAERVHNSATLDTDAPYFAVITSHNCNGDHEFVMPESGIGTSMGSYRGIGASFRASTIRQHIGPHICPAYYNNARSYIRKTFVPDPFKGAWTEQDGLIRRIQMQPGMAPIAYALEPRSYHAGYYGKNRPGKRPKGSLTERIDAVGKVIYDAEAMRKAAVKPAYFEDSTPVTL